MKLPQPDTWLQNWSVRRVLFVVGVVTSLAVAVALTLPLWLTLALVVLLPASLLIPRWRRTCWVLCVVTAVVFSLFTIGYGHAYVRPLSALSGQEDTLTGQVIAVPTDGSMYTLRVTESTCVPIGTRVALYCPSELAPTLYDTVVAQVELLSANQADFHSGDTGTHLFAFPLAEDEDHLRVTDPEGFSFLYCLAPLRERLQSVLRGILPGQEGSVLIALCFGIRQDLPGDITAVFRNSGLTHLLVVSGLHLTLVAVSVRRLFRGLGLGFRLSAILTMPVIPVFMLLVGFTPSVCRAGVMCLVWLTGYLFCRRPDGLNSLGLAAMLVLLGNPYTLLNAGFQLSFMATAGILLIAPRLMRGFPIPEKFTSPTRWVGYWLSYYLVGLLAACAGALLFTLPISCWYFGGFALLLPLANLLMVAPAGWALLLGWVGTLLCLCPFLTWLGQPILYLAGMVSRYLIWTADIFGQDWAFVPVHDTWQYLLLIALCVLLAVGIRLRLPWQRVATATLTLAVLTVAVCYPTTALVTRLSVIRSGSTTALLVQKGARSVLLSSDSAGVDDMVHDLQYLGCLRLDDLVVGAGEPADVARLNKLMCSTAMPTLYTADTRAWETYSDLSPIRIGVGEPLVLWQGCTITRVDACWWRVDTEGGSVLLGVDTDRLPPQEASLTVYTDLPKTFPDTPCVLTCSEYVLTKERPTLTEKTYWLSSDSITYITRPGKEWSVSPWLLPRHN